MGGNFDVLIIGGGAAGVSAALSCANRGKSAAVISNSVQTASLYKAERISNYPGLSGKNGKEIMEIFRRQLKESGITAVSGRALRVVQMGNSFGVAVENDYYSASAVIIAAGITRQSLYPGEAEFLGRGVSYCATCDGMLYRDKTVAVIGSGEEAERDAEFLKSIGCAVHHFRNGGKYAVKGTAKVEALEADGAEYPVDGIFIIKDTVSVSTLVQGLDTEGAAILTDRHMKTNIPGIFAAGDCTGKPYQMAKAVGEGNVAALSACEYVDGLKEKI